MKSFPTQADASRSDEGVMRRRCAGLGKTYPEAPDFYGPGRQPEPREAYYQRNYVALRQPGADGIGAWHTPVDAFMTAQQGAPVLLGDGSAVQLDFTPTPLQGERLGMNCTLTQANVDATRALGLRWIRLSQGIGWGSWHTSQAQYDADQAAGGIWPALQPFAAQVTYAHSVGARVLAIALSSPQWVHGAPRADGGYEWHQAPQPQHRAKFAEYVFQLALCGADAIELINEPNWTSTGYWLGPDHPRAATPAKRVDDYVLLLRACYARLKSDPRTAVCQLGIGGVGATGHELLPDANSIHGTTWYQQLFNGRTADDGVTPITAAGFFDFAAHHPYAEFNTRKGPTEWDFRWPQFSGVYGDAVYAHGMASVQRVREALVAAGCGAAKIWATEVGSPTFGGTCQAQPCVSEALQSTWMQQYVTAWLTNGTTTYTAPLATNFYGDFTGPMFVYQFQDQSNGIVAPTDMEGFFGVRRFDTSTKPAHATLASAAGTPA